MALTNTYNLDFRQGDDFAVSFTILDGIAPLDLSLYTARLQVRKTYGSAVALIDANTSNGRLVIDVPVDGVVLWNVTNEETTAIRFGGDEETLDLVYDLEIVSASGDVICPARGGITLYREVTR